VKLLGLLRPECLGVDRFAIEAVVFVARFDVSFGAKRSGRREESVLLLRRNDVLILLLLRHTTNLLRG
jgi:hypothetical protein